MDYDQLLSEALNEIKNKNINESFTVKSLFLPEKWNSLKRGEKTGFGSYFSHQYKENKFPDIIRLETKGSAVYKKIK